MIDRKRNTKLSKLLSYVLRHKPDSIGIELDKEGWTDVNDLILKINKHGHSIDTAVLEDVVQTCDKKRFAYNLDKTKIRANQGHSIHINHGFKKLTPPGVLFHGTGKKNETEILSLGIDRRNRHHVHLSLNIKAAINVGERHGKPIVFEVDAERMHNDGFVFLKSENDVWLTDNVPADYIKLANLNINNSPSV